MDAFFASVEQHDDPELVGLPVVVCNSPYSIERLREIATEVRKLARRPEFIKGVRGVVASASYEARAFGVRSAMPLAKALALCPDAIVLAGRFTRYHEVAEQLRAIWGEFSPLVEPVSVDEAYLDMTGAELSGGPIRQIGERLKARIKAETGLTASVGIAANKQVAKIASDLQKPDGLVLVAPGDEAATLAPLPVRALQGVGKRTETLLESMGIRTVGMLATANRAVLALHLGSENADSLLRHAVGIDHSPVEPPGDPKSISRETTLVDDTCNLIEIKKVLVGLADNVAWSLRNEGLSARCVYIKLRLLPTRRSRADGGDGGFGRLITRRLTLPVPTDSSALVYETACKLLDATARSTGLYNASEVVRLVGVGTATLVHTADLVGQFRSPKEITADQTADATTVQRATPEEREQRLNLSIDDIRKKYGFDAITPARRVEDRRS
jgi:DNA polymerase-4